MDVYDSYRSALQKYVLNVLNSLNKIMNANMAAAASRKLRDYNTSLFVKNRMKLHTKRHILAIQFLVFQFLGCLIRS